MIIKKYDLETHSEWVIRNALYWISSVTTWELTKDDKYWTVSFFTDDELNLLEFGRLLNDYTLREEIAAKTDRIREQIALSVLTSIEKRLAE